MIAARQRVERLLRRRELAAAVASLVVALVLLVGVHPISDNVVEHAELVCAAAVLVMGFVLSLVGQERRATRPPPTRSATFVRTLLVARPALVACDERRIPLRR